MHKSTSHARCVQTGHRLSQYLHNMIDREALNWQLEARRTFHVLDFPDAASPTNMTPWRTFTDSYNCIAFDTR